MHKDDQKESASPTNTVLSESGEQTSEERRDDVVEVRQSEAQSTRQSPSQRREEMSLRARLQRTLAISPSLVLENSGSVARDHLASERTFLAYVRTSLGCAAAGVALVQLISMTTTNVPKRLERFGKILGAVTEVLSAGIIVIALVRFFLVQKTLVDGKFPPAGIAIWTIVFGMTIITIITFGLMLAITLS